MGGAEQKRQAVREDAFSAEIEHRQREKIAIGKLAAWCSSKVNGRPLLY